MADTGELTFELSDSTSDYKQLADQFLDIESSGWKKESGTALLCKQSTADFYRELIKRSAQVGKARFLSLRVDGKPVAILSDIQSGKYIYSYKTAFDESMASFSPGLQAEIKNIEFMHQEGIQIADSCTSSDNSTINRIWGQVIQFNSVVIGLRPGLPNLATRLMPLIQASATKLKAFRS